MSQKPINNNYLLGIPIAPHEVDLEETIRRKLFTIVFLIGIVIMVIMGIYAFQRGDNIYGFINFFSILLFSSFILILRKIKNYRIIFRIALVTIGIILIFYIKESHTVQGYSSFYMFSFPVYSFFLLGRKEGMMFSLVFGLIAAFFLFDPFFNLTIFNYSFDFLFRLLLVFGAILIMTYYIESSRERAVRGLKEHQEQLEMIVQSRTMELKKSNDELLKNEKRYQLLADNIDDLIWSVDGHLYLTYISPSVSRIYGFTIEEAMQLKLDQWFTPESCNTVLQSYRKFKRQIYNSKESALEPYLIMELKQYKKDGTIMDVEAKVTAVRDIDGVIKGFVGVTRDISERVKYQIEKDKIQGELAQAQKMEAIGTLVGGLAHDFNNILGGIIGSYNILEIELNESKQRINNEIINNYLYMGKESSKRGTCLVKQLLTLSKKNEIKLVPMDINESLGHVLNICKNSFPKSIILDFDIPSNPLILKGDMGQVEQVLLNLCINASHAMTIMRPPGDRQGGLLRLEAKEINTDIISTEVPVNIRQQPKSWIRIKITDTGVGMDLATQERIFEPFFSKKGQDEGSGLGLATSYSIIEKHGGFIDVNSEPGNGSCFSIFFPEIVFDRYDNFEREQERRMIMGSGTILVIDDDSIVLKVTGEILEQCGYDVFSAKSAEKGISLYKVYHQQIRAVLINYSIPGVSGFELFEQLKKINPDIRAILSSGMIESDTRSQALRLGIEKIIDKPYTAYKLSEIINEVISNHLIKD